MPPLTQKERLHHLIIRQSRNYPELYEYTDISQQTFDIRVFVAFGAQSISNDFSPYCAAYKDIYGKYQLFKFTHTALTYIDSTSSPSEMIERAVYFSLSSMNVTNSALRIFCIEPMVPKCLICPM